MKASGEAHLKPREENARLKRAVAEPPSKLILWKPKGNF